jgi:high-affinity K+ transport system ATPase subunit B
VVALPHNDEDVNCVQDANRKRGLLMIAAKHAWIGLLILFLVVLLVVLVSAYWQHAMSVNRIHALIADFVHGC